MTSKVKAALAGISVTLALASTAVGAQDIPREQLIELLRPSMLAVQHLALNPALARVTERANEVPLDATEIARRDARWVEEEAGAALRHTVTFNRTARLLARHVESNSGFSEAFLTDNRGATVAAFPPTSDYWQGDEEKFTGAYNDGAGQVLIGPVELDASTNAYQAQISAPVVSAGRTVGVLVVGVSLDSIEALMAVDQQ